MTTTSELDALILRRAFGCFPSGVVALCSEAGGERLGMAASTFVPVSLDPPLVAVCINKTSTTWPNLRAATALGISVLGENHGAAARALAGRGVDRFAGLATHRRDSGATFIDGAAACIESRIAQQIDAGDHLIVILTVDWLSISEDVNPIIFHHSSFHGIARAS